MIIDIILSLVLAGVIGWYIYLQYQIKHISEASGQEARAARIRKSKKFCLKACKDRLALIKGRDSNEMIDINETEAKLQNIITVLQSPKNTDMMAVYQKLKDLDADFLLILSTTTKAA